MMATLFLRQYVLYSLSDSSIMFQRCWEFFLWKNCYVLLIIWIRHDTTQHKTKRMWWVSWIQRIFTCWTLLNFVLWSSGPHPWLWGCGWPGGWPIEQVHNIIFICIMYVCIYVYIIYLWGDPSLGIASRPGTSHQEYWWKKKTYIHLTCCGRF